MDGEESNTENIGRRKSCIGGGVAEFNTAFLSPIFSVLDDYPSTNCYILIPIHTRNHNSTHPAVRHFEIKNRRLPQSALQPKRKHINKLISDHQCLIRFFSLNGSKKMYILGMRKQLLQNHCMNTFEKHYYI